MPRLETDSSRPSRPRAANSRSAPRSRAPRGNANSRSSQNQNDELYRVELESASDFESGELDQMVEVPPFAPAVRPVTSNGRRAPRAQNKNAIQSAPPVTFFPAPDEFDDAFADELPTPTRAKSSAKNPPRRVSKTQKTTRAKNETGRAKNRKTAGTSTPPRGLWYEVGGVGCGVLGLLLGYNALRSTPEGIVPTIAITALRWAFGMGALVVPVLLLILAGVLVVRRHESNLRAFWRGAAVSLLVLLTGVHLSVPMGEEFLPSRLYSHGGIIGAGVAWLLRRAVGEAGAVIALVGLSIVALLFLTEISLTEIVGRSGGWVGKSADKLSERWEETRHNLREHFADEDEEDEDEDDEDQYDEEEEASVRRRPAIVASVVARALPEISAQDLARAQRAESQRHSPFLAVDELIHPENQDETAPQVLAEDKTPFDAPDVPIEDDPNRVRVEIDQTAPPTSVVDNGENDAVELVAMPGESSSSEDDEDSEMTPNEALEAQALATAGQGEVRAKPRPQRIRRHFGDGPLMPEYFDDAIRALDAPVIPDIEGVEEDIAEGVQAVQETLQAFKIDARVTDVKRGPVITRYEVKPAPGVRVAAIANLDRDMARSLSAIAVRIEAPVPGKNVVGIEVPNKRVHLVRLRDVLEMPEFLSAKSKLSFVLGKDIAGQSKWADLSKMPHMLVAGATNSGKSVCLNTIISSIITRATPDEVKFSLIDPKRVELTLYRDIPHLYHPVVVEPKEAVKVLRGMIVEMDRRYKKFAERGVRNIVSYNEKLQEDEKPLPYIVIVIDELADLMMTAAAEFEKLICRLAQLARATGIHLIVATQRPSVNVITGVIKANIPARVAFAVASQVDSRTILDAVGAERLIGSGDMLFDANNGGKAVRIQGAFLSEEEVNRIVETVKNHYYDQPTEYGLDLSLFDEDDEPSNDRPARSDDRKDDLYDEIREFIIGHQEMSASMIQRKFEIGFPRAARIVDQFERDGILGPADGPKPRKVIGS